MVLKNYIMYAAISTLISFQGQSLAVIWIGVVKQSKTISLLWWKYKLVVQQCVKGYFRNVSCSGMKLDGL